MDAKLTLKLNKKVIEEAKAYAAKNGQSLSRLIEQYLRIITSKDKPSTAEEDLSDYIKSIPQKLKLDSRDIEKEHKDHLLNKHK